jgi:hypothetical protein
MTAPIDLALEETEHIAREATAAWDSGFTSSMPIAVFNDFMLSGRALAYVEQIHAMTRENAALQRKLDDLRGDAREMAEGIGVWHYTSDTLAHKGKFDGCDWPACIAARRILKTP